MTLVMPRPDRETSPPPPILAETRETRTTRAEPNAALIAQTLNADGTPKRPMNAFMIFARRRRPQLSAANQSMRTGEISKILSKEWTQMPLSEKQFYLDQAKHLKDNFNSKYPEYVYRRKPNNSARRRRRADGSGGSPEADEHEHGAHGPADDGAGDTPPARAATYPYPDTGVRREADYFPDRLSDFTLHRPGSLQQHHQGHGYMGGWAGRRPQSYSPSSSSHGSWLTGSSASPAPLAGDDPYAFSSFGGYGGQGQGSVSGSSGLSASSGLSGSSGLPSSTASGLSSSPSGLSSSPSGLSSSPGVPAPSLFGLDGRGSGFGGGRAFLPPVSSDYGSRGSDYASRGSDYASRGSDYASRGSDFAGRTSELGGGRGSEYGRSEFSRDFANNRASEFGSNRASDFGGGGSSTGSSDYAGGRGDYATPRTGDYPTPRSGDYPTPRTGEFSRAEYTARAEYDARQSRSAEVAERAREFAVRASDLASRTSDLPALSASRSTEFPRGPDFSSSSASSSRSDSLFGTGRVGLPPLPRLGGYAGSGGSASPHNPSAPDLLWPKREQ